VNDEFPTLEVAQAVCVSWLAFRGWFLLRGATGLTRNVEEVAAEIEQGKGRAQQAALRHRETWLLPFTRVAVALASAGTGTTAAREQLRERVARARRKLRSSAAWDLVVCAILVGALIYAHAAALEVGDAFFGLGATITLLLLSAVALRVRIERGLVPAAARVAEAIARRPSPSAGSLQRCRICSETALTRVASPEELGARLSELSVVELFICPRCGHVTGAARPASR